MSNGYLIIDKRILPDYYEKVILARTLIESGKIKEVSEAVKVAGISRSTYYKYKDYIFAPSPGTIGRTCVLNMMLAHETGVLSNALNTISGLGANILTITQSLPVHGQASVTLSLDVVGMSVDTSALLSAVASIGGVLQVKLAAVE